MLNDLEKIKPTRQKLGLTQTQLANLAHVSQSLITKIERGNLEPSFSIAKKIFTALDEQVMKTQQENLAKDVCTKHIVFIGTTDTIESAIGLMKKYAISQLPVLAGSAVSGSISEEILIRNYDRIKHRGMMIEEIMEEPFPIVPETMNISLIRDILKLYPAVVVTTQGKPTGIITKADLLKKL